MEDAGDAPEDDADVLDPGSSEAGAPGEGGGSSSGNDGGTPIDSGSDAGAGTDSDVGAAGGPPAVRYVGRVDLSDALGGKFAWSGSGVVARFTGSSISVKLSGGQEYTVLIDGMLRPKLTPGNGTTLIANDLASGGHTIELYRRTEANQGVTQFQGFTFGAGGALLSPPAAPARRLEIIGDSITCGFGNEGANESCPFTPQTENHYLTYGAIAARALGAELHTIAWSGKGVVCNYGDDAQSCTNPLPVYYDRVLPENANSRWDFAMYQPDAVIINLGTNDFSTNQDPSEAEFTNAYRALLLRVRGKYPKALILCTNGPLLYGADLDNVRRFIAKAIADTGDGNMTTFDIPSQSASDGLGCSYHPSLKTHQKMADRLTAALKDELGW